MTARSLEPRCSSAWSLGVGVGLALLCGCEDADTTDPHRGHPAWGDAPLETGTTETGATHTEVPDTSAPAGEALVRFVHLIDDVPALDVELDGVGRVVEGFGWGTASDAGVGYTTVPAGELRLVASRSGAAAPAVIDAALVLEPDTQITVLLVGSERLGLLDPALGPHVRLLPDISQPYPGAAVVTLVHAAPAWPEFDIYSGPFPVAADLGFDEDTGPAATPPGPSVLRFDADGDGVAEQRFQAEMPDGLWLYAYVVPLPGAPPPGARMLIHVAGAPITPVDPTP